MPEIDDSAGVNELKPQTLSVIIPVYYNQESLPAVATELLWLEERLQERGMELEAVFVDDGSGDGSFDQLLRIKMGRPATKLIKLTRNFGAVAASKTGLRYATGDCATLLAADLQDPVAKVLEMVDRWREGAKFVICVRAKREDPPLTKLFAGLYYRVLSAIVMRDYPRTGYDMMLLDKELLPYLAASGKNVNNHLYAYWLGYQPSVISYDRPARQHGRSRWTFSKKLKLFFDTVTGFSVLPIRLISAFGATVAALSFLYGVFITLSTVIGGVSVPGFATIVTLVSFFSGVILLMLGIIGEYLWRVFDNVSNKPESVVEELFL